MLKRKLASATIAICLVGLARLAMAQQNSSEPFRPFNGLFANMFDDGSQQQQPPPQRQVLKNYDNSWTPQPTRAQSPAAPQPQQDADLPAPPPARAIDHYNVPSRPAAPAMGSQRQVTGKNYSFQYDDGSAANAPSGPALGPPPSNTSSADNRAISTTLPTAPAGLPLHERLKLFRQSAFDDVPQTTPSSLGPPPSAGPGDPMPVRSAETTLAAPQGPAMAAPPTVAKASPETLPGPPADAEPPHLASAKPAADAGRASKSLDMPRSATAKPADDTAVEPSVLINHKSPLLSVETIGPRKIVVGKEAAYEVLLQNAGDVAAEEVAVTVNLPEWAEVAGASASSGEVRPPEQDRHEPYRWMLGRIEARSKEKLALRIIPRQSKPFELAVRWDFRQAPSQAMIEVQEPKLTIRLDGPREVFFGKGEVYKLKLGNSGNGVAENVVLTLMPLSSSDTHPITHRLGTVNAGDERAIEIELTARQAGSLTIRVAADCDGGAHVDLAERVLVHRAALQVDVEGPAVQFVGTPAHYKIRVHNSGDALAKNVKFTAKLPTGVKFVSGSDGAKSDAAEGGKVRWTLDPLQPGEQRELELKCTLALSGANRLEFTSTADDEVVATTESVTRVEVVADLRLDVKDPEGPVPIGSRTTYELHVRNRGTKAAENVEVLAYFSSGVEPISAEGQANHISPGQVVFDPIPAIPPATELVLKVKAKAEVAGNHVFRAEVHCKAAGTRLVREEVTYYYQDGPNLQQAEAPAKLPGAAATRDDSRTAERQAPLPLPPSSSGQPLPTPAIRR